MFKNCKSLEVLNLRSFKASNAGIINMFRNCSSLRTIYASNWKKYNSDPPLETMGTFERCYNLVGGKGSKLGTNYYVENGIQYDYYVNADENSAHIDGGPDKPGLFTE